MKKKTKDPLGLAGVTKRITNRKGQKSIEEFRVANEPYRKMPRRGKRV